MHSSTRPELGRGASSSQSSLPLVPERSRNVQMHLPDDGLPQHYDEERAQSTGSGAPGMPHPDITGNRRTSSWDLLAGIKKFEHSYEEFDARNASESHLVYADGDIPRNKVCSFPHPDHTSAYGNVPAVGI